MKQHVLTNDNGDLQAVTFKNGGPGYPQFLSFTQTFGYDGVHRLTSASDTGGWSRNFAYDSFGNMWVGGNSGVPLNGNTPTSNVYTAANRISGSSYDASGNQLAVNGDTATYDAENRLSSVTESPSMGGGTETLVYDGDGKRVQKILPSGTTNYVYDAFGRLVAEYATNPTESPCTTCYLSYDHLGSVRMVTDASATVIARHDFLPFGEELPPNSASRNGQWGPGDDNITQKFTGQIRDEETDLDYFNARYFGAALGRFTSPDPQNAGADPANPQSWNAYSYVLGNPLASVDPSGRDSVYMPFTSRGCPPVMANCVTIPTPSDFNDAYQKYSNDQDAMFYGNLATSYAQQGNITAAQHIATLSGGAISITVQTNSPQRTVTFSQPAEDTAPGMDIWHGQQKLWSGTAAVGNGLAVATAVVMAAPVAVDLASTAIYSGSPTLFASDTPVIGKLANTAGYLGKSGYNVLPETGYGPTAQSTWIGQTVLSGQSYLLASPLEGATGMFASEAGFLQSIGYELSPGGSFLVPPLP